MVWWRVAAVGMASAFLVGCAAEGTDMVPSTTVVEIALALPPPSIEYPSQTSRQIFLVRSSSAGEFVEPAIIDDGQVPNDVEDSIRLALSALLIFTGSELESANRTTLPELGSVVPEGTSLNGIEIDDGVVTIDFGGALANSSGSSTQERLFAQQVAHTALLDSSLTGIQLMLDGREVATLWGHLDWSTPIAAETAALSPVVIWEPSPTTVSSAREITVFGWASVVEGTVILRVEDSSGNVLVEGFTTASEGAPGRGTWAWQVLVPGSGEWTVVAGASDPSGGEGLPPFEVRRTFTVSG